jgi:2-methylcitrate dehydratase PrpD
VEALLKLIRQQSIVLSSISRLVCPFNGERRHGESSVAAAKSRGRARQRASMSWRRTAVVGKMDLSCFEDAMLATLACGFCLSRVTVQGESELDRYFPQSWPGRVRVRLNDGGSYTNEIIVPKAESANPMSEKESKKNSFR